MTQNAEEIETCPFPPTSCKHNRTLPDHGPLEGNPSTEHGDKHGGMLAEITSMLKNKSQWFTLLITGNVSHDIRIYLYVNFLF